MSQIPEQGWNKGLEGHGDPLTICQPPSFLHKDFIHFYQLPSQSGKHGHIPAFSGKSLLSPSC